MDIDLWSFCKALKLHPIIIRPHINHIMAQGDQIDVNFVSCMISVKFNLVKRMIYGVNIYDIII